MSRAYTITQALAEETLLRHTAIAMDKILKTPEVDAVLQAARDIKEDELKERFITWAKDEELDIESDNGLSYDSDVTEYAWRAVKAFCL